MTDLKESITENIKYFRKKLDISQEELSRLCGYSSTYLGKIERGQRSPSLDTLIRIAEALQIPIVSFFDPFFRNQSELHDSRDPSEPSPYDIALRRFHYLVGRTNPEGLVTDCYQLPWFHSQISESKNRDHELWNLPSWNLSAGLRETIQDTISHPRKGPLYLNLQISGVQLMEFQASFVLIPNPADTSDVDGFRFELFYPRIVKEGSVMPLDELSFRKAESPEPEATD